MTKSVSTCAHIVESTATHPKHPGKAADGSSEVGHDASLDSTVVGTESRSAIETKPTEPEQHRAQYDVGRVVRLVGEALSSIAATLTEIDRDGKCCGSR